MTIKKSDFGALSLQDLALMEAVMQSGSVSQAASALGISQSSASYGLEKLRKSFNDPIFTRSGGQMIASALAKEVLSTWCPAHRQIRRIAQGAMFEPAHSDRHFVLAGSHAGLAECIEPVLPELLRRAPNCVFQIQRHNHRALEASLHNGVDLIIEVDHLVPDSQHVHVRPMSLAGADYVTFFDPAVRSAPQSLEDFFDASHAIVQMGPNPTTLVDEMLLHSIRQRRIRLIAPDFAALARLMKGTALITTLPRFMAHHLFRDFAYVDAPLPMPQLGMSLLWSVNLHNDPAHAWLREQLSRAMARES
ncbi:LysR family transcriptional regulator [Ferrimonas pelagia]|uniref:LysR family transcriptional regulator n=1 Tax=Ferrimonas pelagia TaxID=1177826 RepID=A0ABP9EQ43_9GAMM